MICFHYTLEQKLVALAFLQFGLGLKRFFKCCLLDTKAIKNKIPSSFIIGWCCAFWCTNHVYCQSTPYKLYTIIDSVWEKENSILYIQGKSRGETCNIFDTIRDLCSHGKVSPYRCWGINALCIYIIYEATM